MTEHVHNKLFAILECVASEPYGATASGVARQLNLRASTARWHLRILARLGVLERDETPSEPERFRDGRFSSNGVVPVTYRISVGWLLRLSTPHLATLDMARETRAELAKS